MTPSPADARTLMLAKLQQIRRELATLPIQGAWTRIHTLGGALDMVDQVVKDVEAECLVDMVDLLPVDPMLARPASSPSFLLSTIPIAVDSSMDPDVVRMVPGSPAALGLVWDPMRNVWRTP